MVFSLNHPAGGPHAPNVSANPKIQLINIRLSPSNAASYFLGGIAFPSQGPTLASIGYSFDKRGAGGSHGRTASFSFARVLSPNHRRQIAAECRAELWCQSFEECVNIYSGDSAIAQKFLLVAGHDLQVNRIFTGN